MLRNNPWLFVPIEIDIYEGGAFINVGGRAAIPKIAGLERVSFLTNSSMMDVDFLPEHLVVIRGSYIGLEFGQMYRRFGSRVTVIEVGQRLIGREDEDVSKAIAEILEKEGIDIRVNAKCLYPSSSAAAALRFAWTVI